MKPLVQNKEPLNNVKDCCTITETKSIAGEEEQCVPGVAEEWNLSCVGDIENTLDLPSLSQSVISNKRDFWIACNEENSSTCMYSLQQPEKMDSWLTCEEENHSVLSPGNDSKDIGSQNKPITDLHVNGGTIEYSNELLGYHTTNIYDTVITPSVNKYLAVNEDSGTCSIQGVSIVSETDNITTPSQVNNITTPSLVVDDISTPSLVDDITTPSLVDDSITTSSLVVDDITTSSLVDNITTPLLLKNITTHLLVDNITTRSLVDDITTPSLADNITTPSLLENISSPSPINNITTPSLVDNITSPSLVDNITTPSLLENITSPPPINNITTSSLVDNITTPSMVDNITTPNNITTTSTLSIDDTNKPPAESTPVHSNDKLRNTVLQPLINKESLVNPLTHLSDIQFSTIDNSIVEPVFSFTNPPSLLSKDSLFKRLSSNNVHNTCSTILPKLEASFTETVEFYSEPCCKKTKVHYINNDIAIGDEQLDKELETTQQHSSIQNIAIIPHYRENEQSIFTAVPTNTTDTIITCLTKQSPSSGHQLMQQKMMCAKNLLGKL